MNNTIGVTMTFKKALIGIIICSLVCGVTFSLHAAEGITDTEIHIGQCAALEGPAQGLGLGMKTGMEACFARINEAGGIAGRRLKLTSVNDGYEPDQSVEGTLQLIEEEEVFCLAGYVGTPTAKVVVPIVADMQVPLVGLFTGAGFLRDPKTEWFSNVINLRASYDEETELIVERLITDLGVKRIAVFYQDDGFGRVGLNGTTKALEKRGMKIVSEGKYTRNTTAVKIGLAKLMKGDPEAVVMVGAYKPLAEFVKQAKAAGSKALFCTISFVGTENLIAELQEQSDGLIISQVVPSPSNAEVPVIKEFQDAMAKYKKDEQLTYVALEGYITAKLLASGIDATKDDLTRANLVKAFEEMKGHDLGGIKMTFGENDHQGFDQVFMTQVRSKKAVPVKKIEK